MVFLSLLGAILICMARFGVGEPEWTEEVGGLCAIFPIIIVGCGGKKGKGAEKHSSRSCQCLFSPNIPERVLLGFGSTGLGALFYIRRGLIFFFPHSHE